MYGVRAAIPATSRLNVIKYANLVSLLQTNELLGNYRNLFCFGSPVPLPLVEWTAAVCYGVLFAAAFCTVFARAQLLPAAKRGIVLGLTRKTKATSIIKEEARKLFVLNGAAVFLAAFLVFGVYQGVTSESYIDADEIYYAYYMKHISGPWTAESRDWLTAQGEEFAPMPTIPLCSVCITLHTVPPLKVWGPVVTSPHNSPSFPFHVEKALFRFSTIQF